MCFISSTPRPAVSAACNLQSLLLSIKTLQHNCEVTRIALVDNHCLRIRPAKTIGDCTISTATQLDILRESCNYWSYLLLYFCNMLSFFLYRPYRKYSTIHSLVNRLKLTVWHTENRYSFTILILCINIVQKQWIMHIYSTSRGHPSGWSSENREATAKLAGITAVTTAARKRNAHNIAAPAAKFHAAAAWNTLSKTALSGTVFEARHRCRCSSGRGASLPFLLKNDMTGPRLWMLSQLTHTIPWIRGFLHSNASVPHTAAGKNCC